MQIIARVNTRGSQEFGLLSVRENFKKENLFIAQLQGNFVWDLMSDDRDDKLMCNCKRRNFFDCVNYETGKLVLKD